MSDRSNRRLSTRGRRDVFCSTHTAIGMMSAILQQSLSPR